MNTTPELDVHDLIRDLVSEHWSRTPYPPDAKGPFGHYGTTVPALVMQLVDPDEAYRSPAVDKGGVHPASRPVARIESMDTVILIDDEAGEWIKRLGGVIPPDGIDPRTLRTIPGIGTVRRLERLHGLHPGTEDCGRTHRKDDSGSWCCVRGHLEHDVRRWWHLARIVSNWDMAAWSPNNSCPVCDERRKLRVRLDSATCVACHTVWPAGQLGLLAEHIRAENRDELLPVSSVVHVTRTES